MNRIGLTEADACPTNLKRECNRRKTFTNWPLTFLDPEKLAAAGFYYRKRNDIVCCVFCRVAIGKWERGDDPMKEHHKWKPTCPFLNHHNVGNVPFGQEDTAFPTASMSNGYDIYGQENGLSIPVESSGIPKSTGPLHNQYTTHDARLQSYKNWPVSIKQKPNVLSEAGFYYRGKDDETVCFHCGGGVKAWEDLDDPWVEHARWYPTCTFVISKKGESFIDQVTTSYN